MALTLTLTFNDADELLLAALHKRARAHGRSIEEEHRDILRGMPDVGSDADFGRDR